ncbi:hypothetical protein [Tessaracoccus coleopterorum]|uniref:hypothetical protein n=1 Tax=Tessaracoccus coleopterorum TaxID=2714950 RepID=UPI001E28B01A|nr:hypothetical protein [Tessaracoccus coleopterorum]
MAELVAALNARDLSKVPTVQGGTTAQSDLDVIFAGMDDVYPTVTAGDIAYGDEGATATLQMAYPELGDPGWNFSTKADFRLSGDAWTLDWRSSIIAPSSPTGRGCGTSRRRQSGEPSTTPPAWRSSRSGPSSRWVSTRDPSPRPSGREPRCRSRS